MFSHLFQISELQDKLTASETEIAELKNKVDDLEYMYEKSEHKNDSLERRIAEVSERLQFYQETTGNMPISGLKNVPGVPTGRVSCLPFFDVSAAMAMFLVLTCKMIWLPFLLSLQQ